MQGRSEKFPNLDNVGVCVNQRTRLEKLIASSYTAPPRRILQDANSLNAQCFDAKQLMRLAMVAVPAACKLDNKAAALRFYSLSPSPSISSKCPALIATEPPGKQKQP